jgi:hypothetical protein
MVTVLDVGGVLAHVVEGEAVRPAVVVPLFVYIGREVVGGEPPGVQPVTRGDHPQVVT